MSHLALVLLLLVFGALTSPPAAANDALPVVQLPPGLVDLTPSVLTGAPNQFPAQLVAMARAGNLLLYATDSTQTATVLALLQPGALPTSEADMATLVAGLPDAEAQELEA